MVTVVVLVPVALMIVAVCLERFEAAATRVAPAPRVARPIAATAPASHLRLVPHGDTVAGVDEPTTPAEDLRRAA